MAIQSKRNFLGAMRIDTNMLRAIEAGVVSDFGTLVNSVLTKGDPNIQTYVVRGFNHTGTTRSSFTISLADSVFLSQNAGRSMFVFPSDVEEVVPFLNQASDTYYWGFKVAETDAVVQSFAFKDPITNVEYNKTVPTAKELAYIEPYFDTSGTRTDVTFIYKVTVSGDTVTVNGLADIATNKTEYFLSFDGTSYDSLTEWADAVSASVADKDVGGDLSGTYPDATVIGLQGNPISSAAPTSAGQLLGWDGSQWEPTDTVGVANGGTGLNTSGVTAGQILVGTNPDGGFALQDVSGDATMTHGGVVTVVGLQKNPVSSALLGLPDAGKVMAWSGSEWEATSFEGGGGGGGIVFYLNNPAGESPAPAGSNELSPQYDENVQWNSGPITVANDANGTLIDTFVTKLNSPSVEVIPAGVWDLNIYAASNAASNETAIRVKVGIWNGTTFVLKATSDYVYISGAVNTVNEYKISVYMPTTDTLLADRVEMIVEGRRFVSGSHTITTYYGNGTISHVHTTINAAGGTGLMKVVDGYLQSPASLLVNADVAPAGTANIAVNKLADGTGGHVIVGQGGSTGPLYKGISGDATLNSLGVLTLNTVPVSKGGTGVSSLTSNALLVGGTTVGGLSGSASGQFVRWNQTAGAWAATALTGTTNQITVTSTATATTLSIPASPVFTGLTLSGMTVAGVVKNSASGVLSGGNSVSLTSDVTGTLSAPNGGTGQSLYALGDLLYASATNTLSKLAAGTSGQVLTISGGLPVWAPASSGTVTSIALAAGTTGLTISGNPSQTITTSGTFTLGGTLALANGGTNTSLTAINGGSVYSTATGFGITAAGTSGQFLKSSGASAPAWASILVGDVAGAAPIASPTFTGTVTLPLTIAGYVKTTSGGVISSSATVATGDLSGQVSVGNGGTGLATLTAGSYMVGNGGSAVTLKTPSQVTADLDSFAGSIKGLVPASTGGTTNFLRADGSWAAPTITSYYLEAQYSSTTAITNTETSLFNWSQQEASGMQVVNGLGTNDYFDTDSTGTYLVTITGRVNAGGISGTPLAIVFRLRDTTPTLLATFIAAPISGNIVSGGSYVISHTCIVNMNGSKPLLITAQTQGAGSSVTPTWAEEDQAIPITVTIHKL